MAFTNKVKATDDVSVLDATTFDEKLAQLAEEMIDKHTPVKPTVVPGKKKGSYTLEKIETA